MATILVTGTSRGLGQFLKVHLERAGHQVFGTGRSPNASDDRHLAFDVTQSADCQSAVEQVVARAGHLDALINNAGSHLVGAASETSEAELRAQLELNFFGAVNMIRAVLPHFTSRGSGRIINVSSVGGLFATPFASAYAASKFALEGFSEALRLELLPFGVFVSNLEPGYLATGTTDQSVFATAGYDPRLTPIRQQVLEQMMKKGPAGLPLEVVARTVDSILAAERPRFRYSVDGLATRLSVMRALSPNSVFECLVVQQTAPGLKDLSTAQNP